MGIKRFYYYFINRVLFSIKGVIYGKNMKVANHVYIKKRSGSKIQVGDNFTFTSGDGYNPITSNVRGYLRADTNAEILIGNNCGFSSVVLWSKQRITIGNNVLLGGGVLILDSDCHSLDYRLRNGEIRGVGGEKLDASNAKRAPVFIDDDVLVGAHSIILKGVSIGARSVIGAGSVVTQSIPPDCIAAGNPCRIIKRINQI